MCDKFGKLFFSSKFFSVSQFDYISLCVISKTSDAGNVKKNCNYTSKLSISSNFSQSFEFYRVPVVLKNQLFYQKIPLIMYKEMILCCRYRYVFSGGSHCVGTGLDGFYYSLTSQLLMTKMRASHSCINSNDPPVSSIWIKRGAPVGGTQMQGAYLNKNSVSTDV